MIVALLSRLLSVKYYNVSLINALGQRHVQFHQKERFMKDYIEQNGCFCGKMLRNALDEMHLRNLVNSSEQINVHLVRFNFCRGKSQLQISRLKSKWPAGTRVI